MNWMIMMKPAALRSNDITFSKHLRFLLTTNACLIRNKQQKAMDNLGNTEKMLVSSICILTPSKLHPPSLRWLLPVHAWILIPFLLAGNREMLLYGRYTSGAIFFATSCLLLYPLTAHGITRCGTQDKSSAEIQASNKEGMFVNSYW